MEYIHIGPSPVEEDCAQVGSADFAKENRAECAALLNQLVREHPPIAGTGYRILAQSHEFGTYREVIAEFQDGDQAATDWAYTAERVTPEHWDEEALKELGRWIEPPDVSWQDASFIASCEERLRNDYVRSLDMPDGWLPASVGEYRHGWSDDDPLYESNEHSVRQILGRLDAGDHWDNSGYGYIYFDPTHQAVTEALMGIEASLADYGILDEMDYSERQWAADHPNERECYSDYCEQEGNCQALGFKVCADCGRTIYFHEQAWRSDDDDGACPADTEFRTDHDPIDAPVGAELVG